MQEYLTYKCLYSLPREIGRTVHHEVIYIRVLKEQKRKGGVLSIIKVNVESHGYGGYLGLCEGHPQLLQMSRNQPPAREDTIQASLIPYLEKLAKDGSKMTAEDILAVWTKRRPTEEVNVNAVSDQGSVSSVTTATGNSNEASLTASPDKSVDTSIATEPTPPKLGAPKTATAKKKASSNTVATKKAASNTITKKVPVTGPSYKTPKKRKNSTSTDMALQKKARVEDLQPGVRSPDRLANGLYCHGCDHEKLADFIPYERKHFSAHLCGLENYPKVCSGCNRSLLPGKDKEKFVEIKGVFNVKCCRNAINHRDHECVYALCHACFDLKKLIRNSPKKRRGAGRRAATVLPGEIRLADGSVAAA